MCIMLQTQRAPSRMKIYKTISYFVDLQNVDTGAVVDGCEVVEVVSGPRDALEFGCKLTRCFGSRDVNGKLLLFCVG